MATKVIVNKRGSISWRNLIKGFIIAVLTSGFTALQQAIDNSNGIDWKIVAMAALSGGVGYIIIKLTEKPSVTTQYNSNNKAEQVAEDINEK